MSRWLAVATMAVFAVAIVVGCLPDTPNDGNDTNDDGNNGSVDCGTQTVTTIPGPGYVSFEFSADYDVSPADSALAKVIFGAGLCYDSLVAQSGLVTLYEVTTGGWITASLALMGTPPDGLYVRSEQDDWRFEVSGSCLQVDYDAGDMVDPFDPGDLPVSPCGIGKVAIDRNGVVTSGEVSGPYVCVDVVSNLVCMDCWYSDGAWHQEWTVTGEFLVEGTLSGVSVSQWSQACGGASDTVTLTAGDRMTYTQTITYVYTESGSPESMGYSEFVMP